MRATELLHGLGQSIWLDNITRDLLNSGTLKRYIDELSVTGLTSNPTIFDHAIKNSRTYDTAIREKLGTGQTGEPLFFELAPPRICLPRRGDPLSTSRFPAQRKGSPPSRKQSLPAGALTPAAADPGSDEVRVGVRRRARRVRARRGLGWILIASGSELSLAVETQEQLRVEGVRSRVVSIPSWELFDEQPPEYRDAVLPPEIIARVAMEQGSTLGWERYVGMRGHVIGMETFGASAPLKELQKKFGFEPDRVAAVVRHLLGGK